MKVRMLDRKCPLCSKRGARFRQVKIPEAQGTVTFVRCDRCGKFMLPFTTKTKVHHPEDKGSGLILP